MERGSEGETCFEIKGVGGERGQEQVTERRDMEKRGARKGRGRGSCLNRDIMFSTLLLWHQLLGLVFPWARMVLSHVFVYLPS